MRNQSFTLTEAIAYTTESCCSCGVVFALTAEFQRARMSDKARFYCPNGHSQSYIGKSDRELAYEANQARHKAEMRLQAEVDQRKAAARELNAKERELKRLRQRAKGGACPCCNRTFVQLSRHIKSQHPGFQP
jgi:hypothetical protein